MPKTIQPTHNENETRETRVRYMTPAANIMERTDGYLLQMDLPGVRKEGLEVTVEGHELRVTGRREFPAYQGELLYQESRPHDFRRVFQLDPSIDVSKIKAKLENGVVTLELPKSEAQQPRRIQVG